MLSRFQLRSCVAIGVLSATFGLMRPEATAQMVEFRAFWADAWNAGFKSTTDIDSLVSRAVTGRYNVIIPEVMAMQDGTGSGHGAYWHSNILPRAVDVSGGIDALAYLVQQAHANGIQVHPWLVTFRISKAWPPAGNTILTAHPEYLMVPRASIGTIATVGGDYVLDPGSPDAQEYLISIVRELVTNYEIDGIHWDYIRYTQTDAGYPSNTSYSNSGLARFQRITGRTDVPATSDTQWNDFRRREITEFIRRVRAEIPTITSNPRQPLRHSAALVTWGNAPTTFSGSSAYGIFQNWEEWMRLGYLDTGIPMTYYSETQYPTWFRNWVTKEVSWRYQRQMVPGPAIYLNTFANSITQMQYVRSSGADGISTYCYYETKTPTANDWTWYTYVAANIFTTPATVPTMPWRNPATATEGTLWGRVVENGTGLPLDDATVQVGGLASVQTDGNGYYVVTLIPAAGTGTNYDVTASKTGYTAVTHTGVQVIAGDIRRSDFAFGPGTIPPTITVQPLPQSVCPGGAATFSVTATGQGTLHYQWQKSQVNLSDTGHYSGTTTNTLTVSGVDAGDLANYRCVVTDDVDSATSSEAALTLATTTITAQPLSHSVAAGGTTTFTVTASGQAPLTYQWQKTLANLSNGGHYSGVTTATLTISTVDANDLANYRCVVTGGCGSATSNEASLTLQTAGAEFIVESRSAGQNFANYSEVGSFSNSANLSTKSTAAGTTQNIGTRWATMNFPANGVRRAIYSFTPGTTGIYEVYATWPASTNASNRVEHIVTHAAGSTSIRLDLDNASNPSGANNWNTLGQYTLTAGTAYTVTQTNENYYDSEIFRPDAVKWTLVLAIPPPAITQQPQPQNVCLGGTAAFIVTATGAGTLAYQWKRNGTPLSDGGHYSGTATATLTVSPAGAGDIADYLCVVSNAGGGTNSDPATLALKTATAITQQPASASVAQGGTAAFTITATGEGTIAYQWQKDGVDQADADNVSGVHTATVTISNAGSVDAGSYQCRVTAECGTLLSDLATLTVTPSPFVAADFDHDNDVDLDDFTRFRTCFNGPNRAPAATGCTDTDTDHDNDVDLDDFTFFRSCFNGPNRPPVCQ